MVYIMKSLPLLNRLGNYCFTIFIVIGLCYHCGIIFHEFFRYEVSTRTSVFIPEVIEQKAVTLCSRYTDVLDFERLNKETKRNWMYDQHSNVSDIYVDNMTVHEVFHFTPPVQDILYMIRYRNNRFGLL